MDLLQFFEVNLPCPDIIPDCDNLRLQYVTEVNELKKRGMCSGCVERNVRNKYIIIIQEKAKK